MVRVVLGHFLGNAAKHDTVALTRAVKSALGMPQDDIKFANSSIIREDFRDDRPIQRAQAQIWIQNPNANLFLFQMPDDDRFFSRSYHIFPFFAEIWLSVCFFFASRHISLVLMTKMSRQNSSVHLFEAEQRLTIFPTRITMSLPSS